MPGRPRSVSGDRYFYLTMSKQQSGVSNILWYENGILFHLKGRSIFNVDENSHTPVLVLFVRSSCYLPVENVDNLLESIEQLSYLLL